ncbi:uncharacterized protein LOC126212740 [Schistocerca nitens]|uniref:uncharacterized protein LOC126212740 n=1 Tax=Schistocerca nitens TaxID=7011 RepID=UPI00211918C4|nr:uncharacterized protein LOC126212740 [Schistocerca nitens]
MKIGVAVCFILYPWPVTRTVATGSRPQPSLRCVVEAVLNRSPLVNGPLLVVTMPGTSSPHPEDRWRLAPPLPEITIRSLQTVALKLLQPPVINFQPYSGRTGELHVTVRGLLLVIDDAVATRETLQLLLQQANNFAKWNPRSLCLVFFLTVDTQYQSKVAEMFREFDSRNMINCTIVVIRLSGQALATMNSVTLYTWFPYDSSGRCRSAEIQLSVLDEWDLQRRRFGKSSSLFPEKVPRQFDLCHLTAATYRFPPFVMVTNENATGDRDLAGYDIFTIELVAAMLNVSLNITTAGPDSYYLLTELVQNGEVDIAFGGFHETVLSVGEVEVTASYLRDSVTMFVPLASNVPAWTSSFFIIPPLLFVTIIGLQFLLSAISTLFSHKNEISNYKRFCHTYVNFCSIVFSVPVREPVTLTARTIFASWVLFSQVIGYVNQSILTSRMTRPNYEKQITTMEEFYSSDLVCRTTNYYMRFAPRKCAERPSLESSFDHMVRSGKTGVLGPRIYLTYTSLAKYGGKTGLHSAVPLLEDVFAYNVVMVVPTGSPLLPLLNNAILRVSEAALVSPLLYRRSRSVLMSLERRRRSGEQEHNTFISFQPFKSMLTALAVALSFCSVVLLAELFYNRQYFVIQAALKLLED